jgi:hypothetical protein
MNENKTFTKRVTEELDDFRSAKFRIKLIVVLLLAGLVWTSYSELFRIPSIKEKVANLESENGKKASEIQRLETLLVPFKTIALEKYTGSEQEVLQKLAEELQKLKDKANSLDKALSPRILSEEQKNKLRELLSFESGYQIGIACRAFDTESHKYAVQIAEVFKNSSWNVKEINQSYLDDTENDVAITVTDNSQTPTAEKIARILNICGVNCKPEKIREGSIAGIKDNTIYLIIGSKLKK